MFIVEATCGARLFYNIMDAIQYADENGQNTICELGFDGYTFKKCAFCGEWEDARELNEAGACDRCQRGLEEHL